MIKSSDVPNNVVTIANRLLKQYEENLKSNLETRVPDKTLVEKILADLHLTNDLYFSLNRAYQTSEQTFQKFCEIHNLHTNLPGQLPALKNKNSGLYVHQVKAVESILAGKNTLIATGTGSGKTESFLVPILNHCLFYKNSPGIKAIILYPMNALANDQLRRFKEAVKGSGITVGCFVGSTPPVKERQPEDQKEWLISRKEMIDNPPDILITNYVMLDRLITKPETQSMFTKSRKTIRYVVIDEIHYFRGTKGANLALLLKRLRALCESNDNKLVQIGASATLRRSSGYLPDDYTSIKEFAALIFGTTLDKVDNPIEPEFLPLPQIDPQPLPSTAKIIITKIDEQELTEKTHEEPSLSNLDIKDLASQLAEKNFLKSSLKQDPIYEFAKSNPFILAVRDRLANGSCNFAELVQSFKSKYIEAFGREPEQPYQMVEAYWNLICYLNNKYKDSNDAKEPILDFRIHLFFQTIGGKLMRCLFCGRYADSGRDRCATCNGILFHVSSNDPQLCVAYINDKKISPTPDVIFNKNLNLPILVKFLNAEEKLNWEKQNSLTFVLESERISDSEMSVANASSKNKAYQIKPLAEKISLQLNKNHISDFPLIEIINPSSLEEKAAKLEVFKIEGPNKYWHRVLQITDGIVNKVDTKVTSKLLGFIDNREKASGIRFRLRDEFADRQLSNWAFEQLPDSAITVTTAFKSLEKHTPKTSTEDDETNENDEILQEIGFWFHRMLTRWQEYKDLWKIEIRLEPVIKQLLNDTDLELLEKIFLDNANFDLSSIRNTINTKDLKHFYLEKYRVATEFGVAFESVRRVGYSIDSLSKQAIIYKDLVEKFGSEQINLALERLHELGILVKKNIDEVDFYQLSIEHLTLKCNNKSKDVNLHSNSNLTVVECHTADVPARERTQIESKFNAGKIQFLVCTPTLEMGVDIGELSSVLLAGFPPSPANYAQRAGRAGRKKQRFATIVVLAASDNRHDEYYYADPRRMIDGVITPPQFRVDSLKLLQAHCLVWILQGDNYLSLLKQPILFNKALNDFIANDELQLKDLITTQLYQKLAETLHKLDWNELRKLRSIEDGYRLGYFPDYGFRRDGVALLAADENKHQKDNNKHTEEFAFDEEDKVLTTRNPEQAIYKLVPGTTVFCSGRPIRVAETQAKSNYVTYFGPNAQPYREFSQFTAEPDTEMFIYSQRDPEGYFKLTNTLQFPKDQKLTKGPTYCSISYIAKGTLYCVNEGNLAKENDNKNDKSFTGSLNKGYSKSKVAVIPFKDGDKEYQIGTSLEREGLQIDFYQSVLLPDSIANFLAVLLRSLPDSYKLDDSELKMTQLTGSQLLDETEPEKKVIIYYDKNWPSFFLYGQDENGLISFKTIYENLEKILRQRLQILKSCKCDKGCYLCLFSMNSQYLNGTLAREEAIKFLEAFLGDELLMPDLFLENTPVKAQQYDLELHLEWKGYSNITAINNQINETTNYKLEKDNDKDQNSQIFSDLKQTLLAEKAKISADKAIHTLRLRCKPDYIVNQLQGNTSVKSGVAAFTELYLELLTIPNWTAEAFE